MNQVAKWTLTAGVFAAIAIVATVNTKITKAHYSLSSLEPQAREVSQNSSQLITLQTYDEVSIPLKTSYPSNMTVFGTGSGEGVGVSFNFKPQGNGLEEAEISFFLPRGSSTAEEFETFVTGADGLMANNGWNLQSQMNQDSQFPYPWVKKVINFSTTEGRTGKILLGETNNQAIQVILLSPLDMSEVYWQSVKIILDNLEFKSQLLPVSLEENQESTQVSYQCVGGENISVIYQMDDDSILLSRSSQTEEMIKLPHVHSASGAKYSDGTTTFSIKGDEALMEINDKITLSNCSAIK